MFAKVCCVFVLAELVQGLVITESMGAPKSFPRSETWFPRVRRLLHPSHRVIDPAEDCFLVTADEGEVFFKSTSDEPTVCGIYMITEPDQKIQVSFNYLDVPCDNGGLVAWIDGWEMNGQVWPSDSWDDSRIVETCGRKRPKQKLISQQNSALVQYRVPARGRGFAITIRHVWNPKPCNIMLFGASGVITLQNHGVPGNCSINAVSPSVVRVLNLNVGRSSLRASELDIETGTMHKCVKRGLSDFLLIGGATGLDHSKMEALNSICGTDSIADHTAMSIACENTVVKLVSSGRYHNTATIAFSTLQPEEFEQADLMCGLNEI